MLVNGSLNVKRGRVYKKLTNRLLMWLCTCECLITIYESASLCHFSRLLFNYNLCSCNNSSEISNLCCIGANKKQKLTSYVNHVYKCIFHTHFRRYISSLRAPLIPLFNLFAFSSFCMIFIWFMPKALSSGFKSCWWCC